MAADVVQQPEEAVLASLKSVPPGQPTSVNIIMAGKTGSGKTSLAKALLYNDSSGGSFGPNRGTSDIINIQKRSYKEAKVEITVSEVMGFADLAIPDDEIKDAIDTKCDIDNVTALVVCFRWDDRFDETCRKILTRIDELRDNIWEKVTFALTHFDHLSPDCKKMTKSEKNEYLKERFTSWIQAIKDELRHLCVTDAIVNSIQIAPTSHTESDIDQQYYEAVLGESDWLENLWEKIVETATNCQQLNLNGLISMLSLNLSHRVKQASNVITEAAEYSVKTFKESFTKKMFLGRLTGTAVGATGIFAAGAGGGALSGVFLTKTIAAVTGLTTIGIVTTAATGGVFAGVALGGIAITCIVAVVLFAAYKYKQKCKAVERMQK